MAVALSSKILFSPAISNNSDKPLNKPAKNYKAQPICKCNTISPTRRRIIISSVFSIVAIAGRSMTSSVLAEEDSSGGGENDGGIAGAIVSLFDPNEKTKSGKLLPKAYLKSLRDVIKNLRESLKEDPADNAKFRRAADSAKDSIREFLGSWRGQQSVAGEESYALIEKVIRALAGFYSKAGPSAAMPEEVKLEILDDLKSAEELL